ncbi:hypothetical protein [Clavibacter zhangzhiyongii]|uniref:hypothetical protein n=1 Tax=Clavibacter zhangzhiyongii TaxID=2768071 RepID=UPI0039DFE445
MRVVRTPVLLLQLGKGVISPAFIPTVLRESRHADVLNIHAPMVEAGPLAWRASRITRVVTTYHCDVDLPSGHRERRAAHRHGPLQRARRPQLRPRGRHQRRLRRPLAHRVRAQPAAAR